MPETIQLGSRFRTIRSRVGSMPVSFGGVATLELPRSFLYKTLYLHLDGSLDTTVGHASIPAESPLQLLQKIEVIADGRKLLVANDGQSLFRICHYFRGKEPRLEPPGTGVANPNAFSALVAIDFQAARMGLPVDSFFDPRPFEKVELRITFGDLADIATGGDATLNTSTVGVTLFQTTEGADNILFNRLHLFDEFAVTAASTAQTINVPRAGLLAGILLRMTDDAAPVQSLLNAVSLKSDNNFLHFDNVDGLDLQLQNVVDYQLDQYNALPTDVGDPVTGYYYLDLTEDGMISSALNTFDLNVLQLIMDVNAPAGSGLVRASYLFYEPIAAR